MGSHPASELHVNSFTLYARRKCSLKLDHGRLLFSAFRHGDIKGTLASPFADEERRFASEQRND